MPPVQSLTVAYGMAFSRVAVGSISALAPGFAMRVWLGTDSHSDQVRAMGMALGARDLALGLGTLRALRGGADPGIWLKYGALADASDFVATLTAFRKTPRDPRLLIALVALGTAGAGWWAGHDQEQAARDRP